jgi:hypothetical protein
MSQLISLQDAISLTSNFRSNMETILDSTYRNQGILPVCETFDGANLSDLIKQTDCQSIRIYLGMDTNFKLRLVIVGADSNGADILTTGQELIQEEGNRCPPDCPPSSPLNS